MSIYTISAINRLPYAEKRAIYTRILPPELLAHFHLTPDLHDAAGHDLLDLRCNADCAVAEMSFYHQVGAPDPVMYGQITDTVNGQIRVLLYILNDPAAPRFDVDCLPNGAPTQFGTRHRHIAAEIGALAYGLAPGQVRAGLRLMRPAIAAFETFVASLGHDLYFAEPLYYHMACLLERHGFAYERGHRQMERIAAGFAPGGDLRARLDSSTPFRTPAAADSIRLRSWAIHDGILGEPFDGISMYKNMQKPSSRPPTCTCGW